MNSLIAQSRKRLLTLYLHCTTPCTRLRKEVPGARCRVVLFAASAAWLGIAIDAAAADSVPVRAELMERGAYLATIADCTGCHTAGQGHPRFAGGLPIKSPFGIIYSTNITPDTETGIGRYSYDDFARALREGVAKHGKRLYPAMPYPSFTAMSDGDVRALYAFSLSISVGRCSGGIRLSSVTHVSSLIRSVMRCGIAVRMWYRRWLTAEPATLRGAWPTRRKATLNHPLII